MNFSTTIVRWYQDHKRDLPWRKSTDPYLIWLSEIMLQQTRVAQGLPYFYKFTEAFPTIHDLAQASEDQVLKLWQGLGYYSRARNLHKTAQKISLEMQGNFPDNYSGLLQLKGVGEYTAAAIASFCYQEPVAVVDGNVYRVIARYLGIDTPTNSTEGIKQFKEKANLLLDKNKPAEHNQAIMEFGALHCTPKNPACSTCPLHKNCIAFQQGKQQELPVKLKKIKVKTLHFNYLVFLTPTNKSLLTKRNQKGIWQNLFEFPLVETPKKASKKELVAFISDDLSPQKSIQKWNSTAIVHQLSHRKILAYFWIVKTDEISEKWITNNAVTTYASQLKDFAVPVLVERFIEAYFNQN